jgi:hypothetical protein
MPTFELSGPDGATYHLDAPDENAALSAFQSFGGASSANSSTTVAPKPGATVLTVHPSGAVQPQTPPTSGPDRSGFMNKIDAGVRGAADMMTFGTADEIAAGADALFNPIFGTGANAPTIGERYDQNLAKQRGVDKADTDQNFLPRLGGQLVGSLALPGAAADTLAGRLGVGAATGGLYGFGSGEGTTDRLQNAVSGTLLGGAAGVAAPYIARGAAALGNQAMSAGGRLIGPIRGMLNPDAEAASRITRAMTRDINAGDSPAASDLAAAQRAGQPLINADVGGGTTRALARSAANTSPEARIALERATDDRFQTQAPRTAAFLRSITGATGDNEGTQAALQDAARRANRPAYNAAYEAGDRQVWSPELERLSSAPSIQQAMRAAASKWRDWQVHDGFGASNPPAMVSNGGILNLGNGRGLPVYPNLQYWDYAARNIADRAEQARRSGATQEAVRLGGLERQLKAELDRIVPQYQQARTGAARFFGAQDALEAGRNFVSADMANPEAARAIARMTGPERELFRQGFASEMVRRVNETSDRRSVLNQIFLGGSPAARERIQMALGPEGARQLEAHMRVENVMDMARRAIGGNSTTARQLAELGLAGGYGALSGDWKDASAGYLMLQGMRAGGKFIDQGVARRVGEMLASNDPRVLQQALQTVSRNVTMMNAIRDTEARLSGAIGAGASGVAGPSLASGGTKLLSATPGNADDKKRP